MNIHATFLHLLPELMLLLSALGILTIAEASDRTRRSPSCCDHGNATTTLLACFGLIAAIVAATMVPCDPGTGGSLLLNDALAATVRPWLFALALPAVLLAPPRARLAHAGEFKALLLLAVLGLSLAACARHLLMIFVGLEIAGLTFYILTGFTRTRPAADAAIRYFLFGGISAAFLLFGSSLLFGFSPDLGLAGLRDHAAAPPLPLFATLGFLMVVVALAFKLASAPFHFWAPEVYRQAPAATVAMIGAASKLTALVVLARLAHHAFPALAGSASWGAWQPGWASALALLAAVSMILGNLLALGQSSVRRLLAYSAVANAGYTLTGLSSASPAATAASVHFIVSYGLATAGALAVVDAVERRTGSDDLRAFTGLWRHAPGHAVALVLCIGSLAGLPPMAGFAGKFALFSQALAGGGTGLVWLIAIAVAMSAVSLYYYLSVLRRVMDEPKFSTGNYQKLEPAAGFAILLPAAGVLALGIFPSLLLSPLTQAIRDLPVFH